MSRKDKRPTEKRGPICQRLLTGRFAAEAEPRRIGVGLDGSKGRKA